MADVRGARQNKLPFHAPSRNVIKKKKCSVLRDVLDALAVDTHAGSGQ